MLDKVKYTTINQYHQAFPKEIQIILEELRAIIKRTIPNAEEVISYNMPAFKQNGILVYYAAYKNHIGFYPTSEPIIVFKDKLTNYKTSKGAIQFPINESLPENLISEIVQYRVNQTSKKIK